MAFKWTAPRTYVSSEVITASIANEQWRDNEEALNGWVRKTADESVTSSVTLQDDNHLAATISQAGTYVFDVRLIVSSAANAAGDIKVAFTFTNATAHLFTYGLDNTLASGNTGTAQGRGISSYASATTVAFGASLTETAIHLTIELVATGAFTLQLQWAQDSSNANATTVKSGSFMAYKQVAA